MPPVQQLPHVQHANQAFSIRPQTALLHVLPTVTLVPPMLIAQPARAPTSGLPLLHVSNNVQQALSPTRRPLHRHARPVAQIHCTIQAPLQRPVSDVHPAVPPAPIQELLAPLALPVSSFTRLQDPQTNSALPPVHPDSLPTLLLQQNASPVQTTAQPALL